MLEISVDASTCSALMERTSNGWKSDARAKALVDLCSDVPVAL
jgi:hypothetical protein